MRFIQFITLYIPANIQYSIASDDQIHSIKFDYKFYFHIDAGINRKQQVLRLMFLKHITILLTLPRSAFTAATSIPPRLKYVSPNFFSSELDYWISIAVSVALYVSVWPDRMSKTQYPKQHMTYFPGAGGLLDPVACQCLGYFLPPDYYRPEFSLL